MKRDVEATISYWLDPGDGSLPNPEHDSEILLGHWDEENHTMLINDIRGAESSYSLDTHGFAVHTLPKQERDITNQELVDGEYFEEISNMIKEVTGAKNVILFGKVIRQLERGALQPREYKGKKFQPPAPRPHVDFAPDYAEANAITMAPQGAAELIKNSTRWQLLGVWKPIKVVQRDPLTLTDARSVPDSDYRDLSREKAWPGMNLWASTITHGNGGKHRWHYLSDMTPEEVFIFKHFDSKKDSAWRCAHSSFELPGTGNLPPRESVEVRALVGF